VIVQRISTTAFPSIDAVRFGCAPAGPDVASIYLHARYYDPVLGVFLSPDPAEADMNAYRYGTNDPVNMIDPSGLDDHLVLTCPSCAPPPGGSGTGGNHGPGFFAAIWDFFRHPGDYLPVNKIGHFLHCFFGTCAPQGPLTPQSSAGHEARGGGVVTDDNERQPRNPRPPAPVVTPPTGPTGPTGPTPLFEGTGFELPSNLGDACRTPECNYAFRNVIVVQAIGFGITEIAVGRFQPKLLGPATAIGEKIARQMAKRGWTKAGLDAAIRDPLRIVNTRDVRHLSGGRRLDDPATAFFGRDGGYVVRNNRTGDIVQVSDRLDANWRSPWD